MNLEPIKLIFKDFYLLTGYGIALTDLNYRNIVIYEPDDGFCKIISHNPSCYKACEDSGNEGFSIVKNSDKPYCYDCPFGVRQVALPIHINNKIVAFLIAETGILEGRNKDMPYNKALELSSNSLNTELLKKGAEKLAFYTKEKEEAVLRLLKGIVSEIENNNYLIENNIDKDSLLTDMVLSYIQRNYNRKISLDEISNNLHYSKVKITQTFRKKYGKTINDTIIEYRMNAALKKLEENNETINEIAYLCGFSDEAYFSNSFRKFYGISPKEWRIKNKNS